MIAYEISRWPNNIEVSPETRDVAFNRHSMNDGEHTSPLPSGRISVGNDDIVVKLLQPLDEEQFKKTMSRATRATIGFDLEKPDDEDDRDWKEMLKGGLQTALETQTLIFEVSGVSRTCTHQLVRSRRASFHQQSQRASYMGDRPMFRMPESVWVKEEARNAWLVALSMSHEAYQRACQEDISYQDARFMLPEGTCNYIMLEYPVREFLNLYAYRACYMFQWEISHVMREAKRVLLESMSDEFREVFDEQIRISCEKTAPAIVKVGEIEAGDGSVRNMTEQVEHHCTFQGWENVEGQCPFNWAREEARTFKPQYHKIGRKP